MNARMSSSAKAGKGGEWCLAPGRRGVTKRTSPSGALRSVSTRELAWGGRLPCRSAVLTAGRVGGEDRRTGLLAQGCNSPAT